METLITAIQKYVIKNVVLYADRKINLTKNIVNKNKYITKTYENEKNLVAESKE